jgi:hypothetical protein
VAEIHKLNRCHDRLLAHKQALFDHLVGRWRDLFNVNFDVLLDDLTSTYFEAEPPFSEGDKRRHGYSRDHRGDCVQMIIALVVTPERLPLAYEVVPAIPRTTLPSRAFSPASRRNTARRAGLLGYPRFADGRPEYVREAREKNLGGLKTEIIDLGSLPQRRRPRQPSVCPTGHLPPGSLRFWIDGRYPCLDQRAA